MSLETHIAGAEDRLLDSLSFAGKTSASYVTERRSVSFAPQAASNFTPQGVRLMRFNLADQNGWLEGDTLRLIFTLHNASTDALLTPITDSPAGMFRRVRLIGNGSAMIEDIEEYGRVHEMFTMLQSSGRRFNTHTEGWGSSAALHQHTFDDPGAPDPIDANKARTVVVKLLSSFLTQGKAIPLNMVPVVIEIELADADQAFSGTGNSWYITQPRLVGDVLTLDNALQNSYASHILQGKQLPFMMHGLYSIRATIPPGSTLYSLPIARGFTRLSTCYFSFWDSNSKYVNTFRSTVKIDGNTDNDTDTDQCSWNITVGAQRYPEFDCSSLQESWYRLSLAQLMHTGKDSFSISPYQYRTNKFIGAMNFEKALGQAGHSGVNTRSGSQLTLNFRGLPTYINTIHVVLHYEVAVNVSAAGIEVLD